MIIRAYGGVLAYNKLPKDHLYRNHTLSLQLILDNIKRYRYSCDKYLSSIGCKYCGGYNSSTKCGICTNIEAYINGTFIGRQLTDIITEDKYYFLGGHLNDSLSVFGRDGNIDIYDTCDITHEADHIILGGDPIIARLRQRWARSYAILCEYCAVRDVCTQIIWRCCQLI